MTMLCVQKTTQTPTQIWMEGMLLNMTMDSAAISNVFGENPYKSQNLEAVLTQHGIDSLPTTDDLTV